MQGHVLQDWIFDGIHVVLLLAFVSSLHSEFMYTLGAKLSICMVFKAI